MADMWMPEMNGGELVKAIRSDAKLSSLRVCSITADVEAAVPATDVVASYETVYGGVAAIVPGNRVSALLDVPGVVAVTCDRYHI